jgi:hypothetical protein
MLSAAILPRAAVVSTMFSAANPGVAVRVIATVMVQSARAAAEPPRYPSTHSVRAAAGKKSARMSTDTLRPAIRLLASPVSPSVTPYHALILIPNQAIADASGAKLRLAVIRKIVLELRAGRGPTSRAFTPFGQVNRHVHCCYL